jgi:hypothetical protein
MSKRPNARGDAFLIRVHDKFKAQVGDMAVSKLNHLAEFPSRVDVKKWEGRISGIKGFEGKMQHDSGIFADRVEHHRIVEFGDYLADNMNALGFELFQMR